MDADDIAAIAFAAVTVGVVVFQVALALGAPWGAYAMGGASPGRFPPRLRVAALIQAVLLAGLAVIVLASAGRLDVALVAELPLLAWVPVLFSALAVVLNAATRSTRERHLWLPVALVLLGSSLVVALAPA